jgi:hypothetical protein
MKPPRIQVYITRSERKHLIKQLLEKGPFYIIFWFVFDHDWGFAREDWEPVAVKYHKGRPSTIVLRPRCNWKIIDIRDIGSGESLHVLFRDRGHGPVVKTVVNVDFESEVEKCDEPLEPEFEEVSADAVPDDAVNPKRWCMHRTVLGQSLDIRRKLNELYNFQLVEAGR